MKKFLSCFICFMMLVGVSGCGNDDSKNNKKTSRNNSTDIKIDDLDWTVEAGMDSGKETINFNYTNNSDFTILNFKINFTLKNPLSTNEMAMFDEIKNELSWSDKQIKNISIDGIGRIISEPNETMQNGLCDYGDSLRIVRDITHYELMEPSLATIQYLDNDKIRIVYYDFKENIYTEDNNSGEFAFEWPTSEISKLVDKPSIKYGKLSNDSVDYFYFTGMTSDKELFNNYVESCKNRGFNINIENDEYFNTKVFRATNIDGYNLKVEYNDKYRTFAIDLEKLE